MFSFKLPRVSPKISVLFHSPTNWIPANLSPTERDLYVNITNEINKLFTKEKVQVVLFNVVRKFNKTDSLGMDESIPLLACVVEYIRHLLCDSPNPLFFYKEVQLCDALIRKCGIRAHVLIGRKIFLQTLSLTARKWKKYYNDELAQEAADFAFDCIQAWHEAFADLKELFPEYHIVYKKLVDKYHIKFTREDNDPTRLPIMLEQAEDEDLIAKGPDEFLLSESIDTRHHLSTYFSYRLYGEDNEKLFTEGEIMNQDELRKIEMEHQIDNSNIPHLPEGEESKESAFDDVEGSYMPPDKVMQQVITHKAFQIRRTTLHSTSAEPTTPTNGEIVVPGSASNDQTKFNNYFEIVNSASNEIAMEAIRKGGKSVSEDPDLTAGSSGLTTEENSNRDDDSVNNNVVIENRAFLVDGRVGFDTRALFNKNQLALDNENIKPNTVNKGGKLHLSDDTRKQHQQLVNSVAM